MGFRSPAGCFWKRSQHTWYLLASVSTEKGRLCLGDGMVDAVNTASIGGGNDDI